MKKYSQGGFTLIELLVVIAIIGILSSVVLASLSTARNKAADAKIQSQLGAMRAQAELYSGSYTNVPAGVCATGAANIFGTASNGLGTLLNGGLTLANTRCGSNTSGAWAVAAITSTGAWCVDSTGVSKNTVGTGSTLYTTNLDTAITLTTGVSCL